jgi:uncharacterized repeat protein (TIGR01451 family)
MNIRRVAMVLLIGITTVAALLWLLGRSGPTVAAKAVQLGLTVPDIGAAEGSIDSEQHLSGSGYDLGTDQLAVALTLVKYAEPDPVSSGARLTYTIRVTNTGNSDLHSIITDILPTHILLGETSGGTLILPGGVLTWTPVLTQPAGVWAQQVVVTPEMGYAGPLTNVVKVSAEEGATGIYTRTVSVEEPITGFSAENDSPTPLGQATSLTATITAGSNAAYMWAFGDGTTGSGATVTHIYPAVDDYTAVVTASNAVNVVEATTAVKIIGIIYLPLVMNNWPRIPESPVLNPIGNADQDNYYTVSWQKASFATNYTLEEAANASFSGAKVAYQGAGLSWTVPQPGQMPGTYYYRVKARNACGDSRWSNVQSVSVAMPYDLIVNGGFETGPPAPPWVQSSTVGEIIDHLGARTGNWGIYMGGIVNAVDQIYQRVTIPAGAPAPQLSYWRLIRSSDSIDTPHDEMRCVIWDTSGNSLAFCGMLSNVDQSQNWIRQKYNMSAFRGQTVDVGFKAFNDSLYHTQFFIDDVSLATGYTTNAQPIEMEFASPNSQWHFTESLKPAQRGGLSRQPSRVEPRRK